MRLAPTTPTAVPLPNVTMPSPDQLIALFDDCLTHLRLPAPPDGIKLTRDTAGNVNPWLAATLFGRSADGQSGMALYLLPDEASLLLSSPNEVLVGGVRLTSGLLEGGVVGVERRGVPGSCPLIAAEGWGQVTPQDLVNFVASIGAG